MKRSQLHQVIGCLFTNGEIDLAQKLRVIAKGKYETPTGKYIGYWKSGNTITKAYEDGLYINTYNPKTIKFEGRINRKDFKSVWKPLAKRLVEAATDYPMDLVEKEAKELYQKYLKATNQKDNLGAWQTFKRTPLSVIKNKVIGGVPTAHQKKIALDTLKMSDAGARIAGGMSKPQAVMILQKNGYTNKKIFELLKKYGHTPFEIQEVMKGVLKLGGKVHGSSVTSDTKLNALK